MRRLNTSEESENYIVSQALAHHIRLSGLVNKTIIYAWSTLVYDQ